MPAVRRRPLLAALAAPLLVLAGCGGDEPRAAGSGALEGDLTVFAAASLTDAFTQLGGAFQAEHPDVTVTFNFGASSALVAQILEGAPADVFASADQPNMAKLVDAGEAAGAPVAIAGNRLAIAVEPGNPLRIAGLADLARPDVVLVLCAEQVPCGRLGREALAKAGVAVTPASEEENVRAVLGKVSLGEADAGIVYATDILAAGGSVEGVDIPHEQDVLTLLEAAATAGADAPEAAEAFVEFVAGPDGQAVLADLGFLPPAP